MPVKHPLLFLLTFLFFAANAQIDLRTDTTGYVRPKPKNTHDKPNIIKADMLYWVRGVEPIYYERKLADFCSIQIGIGLTTRDFIADAVNAILQKGGTIGTYENYANYTFRKAGVGVYASIQPKFFVLNEALEGFWLGPVLEFKQYNYKAQLVQTGFSTGYDPVFTNNYMREYRNAIDFSFNMGYQWMFNPLVIEYYWGVGFRKFWEVRREINVDDSYQSGYYYSNSSKSYSGFRPEFNMGLNFGGFF